MNFTSQQGYLAKPTVLSWAKFRVAILWLASYYLLFSITDGVLYAHEIRVRGISDRLLPALYYLTTSLLFFCSIRVRADLSKHVPIIFACALVGASLSAFSMFKLWVETNYSFLGLDWLLVALPVAWLVIGWSRNIAEEEAGQHVHGSWRAGPACFLLTLLVLANLGVASLPRVLMPRYAELPVMSFCVYVLSVAACLIITVRFIRIRSLPEFAKRFGFTLPRSRTVVSAILVGMFFGGSMEYLVHVGAATPHNAFAEQFRGGNVAWLEFLMLGAPFWEETILRGYIYRAFRQDYSIVVSLGCMLLIGLLTHFRVSVSAPLAGSVILIMTGVLSLFREKTDSLWNCIACHFAYNVTCMFAGNQLLRTFLWS